ILPERLREGIIRDGRLRSGHQAALRVLGFLGVIYVAMGFYFSPVYRSSQRTPAALFFLLFLLVILTWLFSGAAFFLDALRAPVLITLIVLSMLSGVVGTDHNFEITKTARRQPPSPTDVV